MCQYGTLLAHSERMGVKPVLSNGMKQKLLKHFPNIKFPSESEIPECAFNWTDIRIGETNSLGLEDLKVSYLY